MDEKKLLALAAEVREKAYCPYSGFAVGAALLCSDGSVYTGCNIENAAFSPGVCAERVAAVKAVSDGKTRFDAIAVLGGPVERINLETTGMCAPCGVCRQFLREFCDPRAMRVILASVGNPCAYKVFSLEELLPESFGPDNLRYYVDT